MGKKFLSGIKTGTIFTDIICFLLVLIIGYIDYITDQQISLSFFYLIPVLFITWLRTRERGITLSIFGTIVWLTIDINSGTNYFHPAVPYWNAVIVLCFFITSTIILSSLKTALKNEKKLSRVDYLTGVLNSRAFMESADDELNRMSRYGNIFTMIYMDHDNFKSINDTLGHLTGDDLLRTTAVSLRDNLRKSDIIARLGGDEFAVLLPETTLDQAENAISKAMVKILDVFKAKSWPVTFSIGMISFTKPPESVDQMIKLADDLMYRAKKQGKNMIERGQYN